MTTALSEPHDETATAEAGVPARLKLLCVATLHHAGGWVARALESEGAAQVRLDEAVGATSALARLRDEVYDAVLTMHEPGVLDATEFVEGLRAGGHDEPVVVLGEEAASQCAAACYEAGADAYCPIRETTARTLLWEITRATRRCALERDNRRLLQAERQRLAVEHQEAERLLAEQRGLLIELDALRQSHDQGATDNVRNGVDSAAQPPSRSSDLPETLVAHYRDVLRAYVIMGVGNLTIEMSKLADLLASQGIAAQRTVQLHLDVVEQLVRGLGARSARHVMNRADLLILELMIHLADGYRRRYHDTESPPHQRLLPGFGPGDFPPTEPLE